MRGILKSAEMKTNDLYSVAESGGIKIERYPLPKCRSVSANIGKQCFVALDSNVGGAEERVCLAHEIGHCETMSFYNMYSPLDIRGKHERRADRWAIERLVPLEDYRKALKSGYTELHALSEHFGVTEDFMRKAAEYYNIDGRF